MNCLSLTLNVASKSSTLQMYCHCFIAEVKGTFTVEIKGILSDFKKIFLWHEPVAINKKADLQNINWFQFCVFLKLPLNMCVLLLPFYRFEKCLVHETSCGNCSHSILKWLPPNPLGFLKEAPKYLEKVCRTNFDKSESPPLFDIREYAFKNLFYILTWYQLSIFLVYTICPKFYMSIW